MPTWYCVTECFHPASLGGSSRLFRVGETYEAQPNENLEPHFVKQQVVEKKQTPQEIKNHPAYRQPERKKAMQASEFFKIHDKSAIKTAEIKHVGFGRYEVNVGGQKIHKATLGKKEAEKLRDEQ